MDVITMHKWNDKNEYPLPNDAMLDTILKDGVILDVVDYYYNVETNVISLDVNEFKTLECIYKVLKEKIIGFTDKHIFKYCDGPSSLMPNGKYNLTIDNHVIEFNTKLSPMYCKPKDVMRLIGTVLSSMDSFVDIEDFIFSASLEIDAKIEGAGDIPSQGGEISDSDKKRLCAAKASLAIIYQYYYELLDKTGTNEDSVGTLKVKRQRLEVNLSALIERFKDIIKDIESGQSKSLGSAFTKASGTEHPVGSRLW